MTMKNYDIESLNEEQKLALKEIDGAVLVTAGAGSGKTRLLTHRVAYLIDQLGVSPYNILAITFTNKAAGEMKERISKMVQGAENVWISTFHSMCARILRKEIGELEPYDKNFSIYSDTETDKLVKDIFNEKSIIDDKDKLKKSFYFHLSNWKNGTMKLSEYIASRSDEEDIRRIGSLIYEYEARMKKNNALDFDDLLRKTLELFLEKPHILEYYSTRFKYILVDEFQDTNSVQYKLVKMLAKVHGNVFVVGDEDQCIYSWRGANFQNIFDFKKDFQNVKVFKLERNYRSTASILNIANNVIKNNLTRLDKNMWTEQGDGEKPVLYNAYDERDEALYVAKNVETLHSQGYDYKDIAVLMRMNALSRSFEEAFLSYNIPYRIFGGFKFYERAEIKNLISYLRIFINKKDNVSFEKIINFPKRGIGEGGLEKLRTLAGEKTLIETVTSSSILNEPALYKKLIKFIEVYKDLDQIDKKPISSFVEKVISKFEIRGAYSSKDEDDLNRLMNIEQFISSVKEYETLNPDAELGDFLESITLKADSDEIGEGGSVTIATIHAVKGLEFKAVFVIGLEEGMLPISRAIGNNSEIEEERRLLYVALTRAEERLFMTHCSKRYIYRESQYQTPSRFCRELGLLSLEKVVNSNSNNNYHTRFGSPSPYNDYQRPYSSYDSGVNTFENNSKFFNHKSFLSQNTQKIDKKEDKPAKDVSIYHVGQRLSHPRYGEGILEEISADGLVGDINFEGFGKKSLMLELAPLEILEE